MADEAPDTTPSESPDGVFGNLPGTRPGGRSPRRRTENGDDAATTRAASERPATPPPPPEPEPPPGAEREAPVPAGPSGPRISSVEDLAWAGIAVAAHAATVGVRFAGRAFEAARRSVDRD